MAEVRAMAHLSRDLERQTNEQKRDALKAQIRRLEWSLKGAVPDLQRAIQHQPNVHQAIDVLDLVDALTLALGIARELREARAQKKALDQEVL